MCFIDWATKCQHGQDKDYYGMQGCSGWAKKQYCDAKETLETSKLVRQIFFFLVSSIVHRFSNVYTAKQRTLIFPSTFRARASRSNYRIWLISTSQLSPPASTAQTLERMTLIVTATTPPTSADSEEKTKSFQPQILDLA